jgi:hypothetical protein
LPANANGFQNLLILESYIVKRARDAGASSVISAVLVLVGAVLAMLFIKKREPMPSA